VADHSFLKQQFSILNGDDLITANLKLDNMLSRASVEECAVGDMTEISDEVIAAYNFPDFGLEYYDLPPGHQLLSNPLRTLKQIYGLYAG